MFSEGDLSLLTWCWPVTCLGKKLQSNGKSAARKRPPVNHARTSPEVASKRLDEQEATWLPNLLGHNASAAGTYVLRARRFGYERLAQPGQPHRLHR
jgi:hypothetical protein